MLTFFSNFPWFFLHFYQKGTYKEYTILWQFPDNNKNKCINFLDQDVARKSVHFHTIINYYIKSLYPVYFGFLIFKKSEGLVPVCPARSILGDVWCMSLLHCNSWTTILWVVIHLPLLWGHLSSLFAWQSIALYFSRKKNLSTMSSLQYPSNLVSRKQTINTATLTSTVDEIQTDVFNLSQSIRVALIDLCNMNFVSFQANDKYLFLFQEMDFKRVIFCALRSDDHYVVISWTSAKWLITTWG